jgi:hypothetical protein
MRQALRIGKLATPIGSRMKTRGITWVLAVVLAAGALFAAGQLVFPPTPDFLPIPHPESSSDAVVVVPAAPEESEEQEEAPLDADGSSTPPAGTGPVASPGDTEEEELAQVVVGEDGYVRDGRVSITLGSPELQGVNFSLERRLAPLLAGECGAFGPWVSTSDNASLPPGSCALYRILVDGAVYFTLTEVVRYDGSLPELVGVEVLEEGEREFVVGSTLYVAADATSLRPVTVTASASDPESGIASVSFRAAGSDAVVQAAPWSAQVTPSVGSIEVTAVNNAGEAAGTAVDVVADGEAPHGGTISYPALATAGETVSVTVDPGLDAGAGLDASAVAIEKRLAVLTAEGCDSFGGWTPAAPKDTALEGTCAQYRLRVQDNVANEAIVRSDTILEVPDETAPVTAITSPAPGAELVGNETVTAAADDSGAGISSVTIQANGHFGSWIDLGTSTTAPYVVEWETVQFKPGPYRLRSVAVDRAGNTTTSEVVGVVVAKEKTAPTTWITKPVAGATVSGVVTVAAQAEDHESGVDSVTLQVRRGGCWAALGAFSGPVGSVAWDTTNLEPGRYSLRSVATDRRGNIGVSESVDVMVEAVEVPDPPSEPEPEPAPPDEPVEDPADEEPVDEEPPVAEEPVEDPAGEDTVAEEPVEEEEEELVDESQPGAEAEPGSDVEPKQPADDAPSQPGEGDAAAGQPEPGVA